MLAVAAYLGMLASAAGPSALFPTWQPTISAELLFSPKHGPQLDLAPQFAPLLSKLRAGRPITMLGVGSSIVAVHGGCTGPIPSLQNSECENLCPKCCGSRCGNWGWHGWARTVLDVINAAFPHDGHTLYNFGEPGGDVIPKLSACPATHLGKSADLVLLDTLTANAATAERLIRYFLAQASPPVVMLLGFDSLLFQSWPAWGEKETLLRWMRRSAPETAPYLNKTAPVSSFIRALTGPDPKGGRPGIHFRGWPSNSGVVDDELSPTPVVKSRDDPCEILCYRPRDAPADWSARARTLCERDGSDGGPRYALYNPQCNLYRARFLEMTRVVTHNRFMRELQRVYGLPMASMLETYGEEFEGAYGASASVTRAGAAPAALASPWHHYNVLDYSHDGLHPDYTEEMKYPSEMKGASHSAVSNAFVADLVVARLSDGLAAAAAAADAASAASSADAMEELRVAKAGEAASGEVEESPSAAARPPSERSLPPPIDSSLLHRTHGVLCFDFDRRGYELATSKGKCETNCMGGNPGSSIVDHERPPTILNRSVGWSFVATEPLSRTQDKPGIAATEAGATLLLSLELGGINAPLLAVQHLVSWNGMGVARLSCIDGCRCSPTEIDAHRPNAQISILEMLHLAISPSASGRCDLEVRVLERTNSEGHRFKLARIIVEATDVSARRRRDDLRRTGAMLPTQLNVQ